MRAARDRFVALLVGAVWLPACAAGPTRRIDDRTAVLDSTELPLFENHLDQMQNESGVDIRFVFVDSVAGGGLEAFAIAEARALGIGRDLDHHGVLFAYDVSRQRLRIEVGPTLQGLFTDRFAGYLMRDHVRSFFAAGNPTLGLRLTLFMLHARLRRAALGEDYDPRAAEYIEDRRRLATGGGATGAMTAPGGSAAFLNSAATAEARALFRRQPTVEQAYNRYLEWLLRGRFETDVDLLTPASQGYLSRIPVTPAFTDYVLFLEYGLSHRILVRGDLALLYFTDDPLVSPHFFRRTGGGWQMDLFTEVRNTREYVGGAWTWSMVRRDDDFTRTFADRYTAVGEFLRLVEGDNRPIPIRATEIPGSATQPGRR